MTTSTRRSARVLVRAVAALVALVAATAIAAPGADAGGAHWRLDHDGYRPGEVVVARSGVVWGHNPNLGQPEEAPYRAYLVEAGEHAAMGTIGVDLAGQVARSIEVGEVQILIDGSPMDAATGIPTAGLGSAVLTFTLPDLAPGHYAILHCGTPCRTYLGDLMAGELVVRNPDGSTPPDTRVTEPLTPPPTLDPRLATQVDGTTTSMPAPTTATRPSTTPGTVEVDDEIDTSPVVASANADDDRNGPAGAVAVLTIVAAVAVIGSVLAVRRRHRDPAGGAP